VFTGAGHVVVVQPLVDEAVCGVQVGAPAGPTTITGQLVVVQPFPELAALGVQDETGTFVVLLLLQVVEV
jgi:hypothetical protein